MINWKAAAKEYRRRFKIADHHRNVLYLATYGSMADLRREWERGRCIRSARSNSIAAVFALVLRDLLNKHNAQNYIETDVYDDRGCIRVTVQRVEGKSPGQMHREAREECNRLRAELDALREKLEAKCTS